VLGDRWPPADVRLEMLEEAISIIRLLWTGETVTHRGRHYMVEDACIFDLPNPLPPIVESSFGNQSARLAARAADGLWTTGVPEEVIESHRSAGGDGPIMSQLTLCWDEERDKAVDRAQRIWPNTALPGQLAQDIPTVAHFEQAVGMVKREDIEGSAMPLGPDPRPILDSMSAAEAAGIDHIYLHQVGDPLGGFLDFWSAELQPQLRN
jgi:coenzyme F420-dependent glucose-6-phosphate dehydrogenase